MGQHIRAIRRLSILLLVWTAAAFMCAKAYASYQEKHEMQRQVDMNQAAYDSKLSELTRLLETQERIKSDTDTQIDLLKQKLGYCEPGEIPIIIVDRTTSTN
ncbi:MAG: hypothetical protein H7A35_11390 [Planctomycetales bacterium]|nr:hypothetical protein [bacterium]UNM07464.1 MAG: hypothetical protein H7A35_11390 [Planctomycetales bacterium]